MNHLLYSDRMSQSQLESMKEMEEKIGCFMKNHSGKGKPFVFLTSGGTSVPLEKHTVRSMENFSTGTRGSLLAQNILEEGFPLIFFYRDTSFLPYLQGLTIKDIAFQNGTEKITKLLEGKKKLQQHKKDILLLPFKTIYQYLNGISLVKSILKPESILIFCAAVSDFIPEQEAEHKIQTAEVLDYRLVSSPKTLGKMASDIHLSISFKLETDKTILEKKIDESISKYGIDMVVGNILNNKSWVYIKPNSSTMKEIDSVEVNQNHNIEKQIIKKVLECWKVKFG